MTAAVLLACLVVVFLGGAVILGVAVWRMYTDPRDDVSPFALLLGLSLLVASACAMAGMAYHDTTCRLAPASIVERTP